MACQAAASCGLLRRAGLCSLLEQLWHMVRASLVRQLQRVLMLCRSFLSSAAGENGAMRPMSMRLRREDAQEGHGGKAGKRNGTAVWRHPLGTGVLCVWG